MSDTTADTPPMAAGTAVSRDASIPAARVLIALIRREFWEHRALWMVPTLTAGLMLLSAVLTRFRSGAANRMPFPAIGPQDMPRADLHQIGIMMTSAWQIGVAAPIFLAAAVTLFFYLLSSLYDERKDRSILFWKSLPISDAATVLSKVLVALLIVPLGVFALAMVTHLIYIGIWDIRHAMGLVGPVFVLDVAAWLKVVALMLTVLLLAALWYAPIAGYLLLISAWARRNPFLWALLPPLILAVVERVAFGTRQVTDLLLYRLGGVWFDLASNFQGRAAFNAARLDTLDGKQLSLPSVFDMFDLRALFGNVDLWIGVIIAAGFVYAGIRLRRYRDDT
jgi:ABC-2 type transport system permease protein